MNNSEVRPFLRWVGGKQHLVRSLAEYVPKDLNANGGTYFEPFLGAGSLFFYLRPPKAVLSDANKHLIHCFTVLRDCPKAIHRYLREHERHSSEQYFYRVRNRFNEHINSFTIAQAGRFFYLNRACFNGIFRVNTRGEFNVPYGFKKNLLIPSYKTVISTSSLLKNSQLDSFSFEVIIPRVNAGDFAYLDPPYPPLNGSSYFTHYTKERFNLAEQQRVAQFARTLSDKGCRVLISNADTSGMRSLYRGWSICSLKAIRFVSCKSKKHEVGELLIANYELTSDRGTSNGSCE